MNTIYIMFMRSDQLKYTLADSQRDWFTSATADMNVHAAGFIGHEDAVKLALHPTKKLENVLHLCEILSVTKSQYWRGDLYGFFLIASPHTG